MQMIMAVIPEFHLHAVRRELAAHDYTWTEHRSRGGWLHHRSWTLWSVVPDDHREDLVLAIRRASPDETRHYRPSQAWDVSAWLHPTEITIHGAVVTWWAVSGHTDILFPH